MLRVRLLGQFSVQLDDQAVEIRSRPAQSLLAYLILDAGVSHRRERVAGLLWPESTEANARSNLRHALWRVRKALGTCRQTGRSYIHADDLTIGFDVEADCWLDVAIVARKAGDRATTDELIDAISAYQGELLPGFYDDWVTLERERLQAVFERKMQLLLERLVEEGRWSEVIERAEGWIALGHTPEPAYRALMVSHSALGEQSGVAAAYQRCADALRQDLDVEVSQQTRDLYERLSSGEAIAADAVSRPETRDGAAGPRHHLPVQAIPFVGREAELQEIAEHLQDPDCRLLTLVGPGGSGKTRLAIEAAVPRLDEFEHGLFFVPLAGLHSASSIVPTVAQSLGLAFYTQGNPEDQLLSYLRNRRLLLILDNFEHLLAGAGEEPEDGTRLVTAIVEAAPEVKIVVTSRAALRLQHEQLYPVTGMAYPEQGAGRYSADVAVDATAYSAIELFVEGARRVDPRFRVRADNVWEVIRICDLVAGMPLGVLIASSWVRMLTPTEIVVQLEEGLDLLETDLRDVPARQRSMRAVFDHSWNLLTARSRAVMQALSVFRGGFTRPAARAVAGARLGELRSLVDRSLIQRTSGQRYQIHELLRQYAAERLGESPRRRQGAHDRHSDYYTAALELWGEDLKGPRQRDALLEMDLDIENARAAWDWAVQRCHDDHLLRAAFGLSQYYGRRARTPEAEIAFREAAERLRAAVADEAGAAPDSLRSLAKVLRLQAEAARLLGHSDQARELLEESLDLLRRPELTGYDTRLEESCIWLALGYVQRFAGRGGFRQLYERSVALARSTGDQWQVAVALEHSADCDNYDGELRAARVAAEECLEIARALGDLRGIGCATYFLGWVLARMGEVARGTQLTREGARVLEELGDPERLMARLLHAVTLGYAGQYAQSRALLQECLDECVELGIRYTALVATQCLGWIEVSLGECESAREHLATGLRLSLEFNDLFQAAACWEQQARIALREGRYEDAECLCRKGIDACERVAGQEAAMIKRCWLAIAQERSGGLVEARRSLTDVLRWTVKHQAYYALVETIASAAAVLLAQGETIRAIETFELARTFPFIANSRWHEDVVGRPIAEAAASLPPDVVAAARERGRARDMQATLSELIAEWGEANQRISESAKDRTGSSVKVGPRRDRSI